jgi:hypothetical protein
VVRAVFTGVLVAAAACTAIFIPWAFAGSSAVREFSLTIEVGNYLPPAPYATPGQKVQPITGFRYLVNRDNTGDPSDSDPSLHPGVHPMESHSPVVETGEITGDTARLTLPEGRYLITVLDTPAGAAATAHKIWGVHVRLPEDAGTTEHVDLIPLPLPLAKIVAHVFQDSNPVNGAPDVSEIRGVEGNPAGLEGFNIILRDASGSTVTRDYLGNAICTEYNSNGRPVGGSGGRCLTGSDGTAVVPNLPPGKYQVSAVRPGSSDWIQTTTFEGGSTLDARITEGDDGTGAISEELPATLASPTAHWFGFARKLGFADQANPASRGQSYSGRITGCARNWVRWGPFDTPLINEDEPFHGGWVALSMAGSGEQAYAAPLRDASDCPEGAIDIQGVPPGSYRMFLWNEQLTSVSRDVRLAVPAGAGGSGAAVELSGDDGQGNVGAFRHFGWLSGYVYTDLNANGVRDLGPPPEPGVPDTPVEIRARDGSVISATVSDAGGFYEFPQALSRLSKFEVADVGLGRFVSTGPSLHSEYTQKRPGDRGAAIASTLGAGLVTAQLITEGHRSTVDWGKRPSAPSGAGEIAGVVQYATTRREPDPRFARAEHYEPGIPGVAVKIWTLGSDGQPDTADDVLVDNYQDGRGTDRWEQPSDCDVLDATGSPVVPGPVLPLGPDCLEFPILGNETKDATFDGGYAFTDICPLPDGWPCADADRVLLTPGEYVIGVELPRGYEIVKEEDVNVAKPAAPAGQIDARPCVGKEHLVPATSVSPYKGQTRPLCDKRRVTLSAGEKVRADFFAFTQVPAPGRVFGLLTDDLDLDTDTESPRYGEPPALAGIPIGIRDYSYRLLTTVSTDELGFYEALLPGAQTGNCEAAIGLCPATYLFVLNDPGDPARPNATFRPNLSTESRVVEVMSGTTTRLDTRLAPIAGRPCADYVGPEFFAVDRVAVRSSGTEADRLVTISGVGFGDERVNPDFRSSPGGIALVPSGGARQALPADAYVSWSDTEIKVTVPQSIGSAPLAPGPYQLLVTAPPTGVGRDAVTAPTGITLHWLGAGYDLPRRYVDGGSGSDAKTGLESAPFKTIQRALDASPAGTLIIVKPAIYRENPIVYRRVKLQGFGPGGINGARLSLDPGGDSRRRVPGTVIDAAFFNSDPALRSRWDARLARIEKAGLITHPDRGNKSVPKGAGITVVAKSGAFTRGPRRTQIDGFAIHSARTDARGVGGGGIFVNGFGSNLKLSNNLIAGNQGQFGGGIVVGLPYRGSSGAASNGNDGVAISYNRILGNGGSRFAGAVGIYNGADGYTFNNNHVCSNLSRGRGAGFSHYGKSEGGQIVENTFASNDAVDGGAGVSIAGQVPLHGGERAGTGAVDVARNYFSSNQARGDGGAVALRDTLTFRIGIRNNIVTNNNAAGMGGAVALVDSSNVRVINNTIARNTSTSTCPGCLGSGLHSAGLASEINSPAFQSKLPAGSAVFSSPVLLNNLFWENEAFTFDLTALPVTQGLSPLVSQSFSDFEVFGRPDLSFRPTFSALGAPYPRADPTNAFLDLGDDPFVSVLSSGFEVGFNSKTGEILVKLLGFGSDAGYAGVPGDYHLCSLTPPGSCLGSLLPIDSGAEGVVAPPGTIVPAQTSQVVAPSIDIDGVERPLDGNGDGVAGIDVGADELAPETPQE